MSDSTSASTYALRERSALRVSAHGRNFNRFSQRPLRLCGEIAFVFFFFLSSYRLFVFSAADIYDTIGLQRLESKHYDSAVPCFAKSVHLAGNNFEYQMDYGDSLYAQAGQTKDSDAALAALLQAKQAYLKATVLNPREGNAWHGLAQTCWWLSRFKGHENELENVEQYFQQSLATDPNNGKFLYAMVDYYLSASCVLSPQSSVLSPQSLVSSPKSSVLSPQSLVSSPQSSVLSPQSLVSSPQSSVLSPQSLVSSPQSSVLSPQSLVSSPQSSVLSPQSLVSSPQPGLGSNVMTQSSVLSPQSLVSSPQSLVSSPQSLVSTAQSSVLSPQSLLPRLAAVYPSALYDLKKHQGWSDNLQDSFVQGLKTAATNHLTDESALTILAGLSTESKDWDQAATYTEQLIRQTEGRAPVPASRYLDLGCYQLKSGNMAEAKKALLQALKFSQNRIATFDDLESRLSIYVHQWSKSVLPQSSVLVTPEISSPGPQSCLALYLDLAKETASFDPTVFSSLPLIRGKAYFIIADDLDSAETWFHQALQIRETAAPHRYLAEIAMKRKDWGKAELESHRAIMLAPKDSHLYYLFAVALREQERYFAALEAIGQAIQITPEPNEFLYNTQGWLYWSLNDYLAAIQSWGSASRIAPKAPWPSRQIAQAYKMLKDYAAAERFYQAALQLDPSNADIAKELQSIRDAVSREQTTKGSTTEP